MASEMKVERSVLIQSSKENVFEFLKITRNQEQFSVWNMADPNKKTTTSGDDGTVGFVYSWDSTSKNVGAGSQRIAAITNGSVIEYALVFERPMKNTGTSKFILEDAGDGQTKVTWDFRGPTKFPMSLFKGLFQRMLGKDIEQSLKNLKAILDQ